MIAATLCFAIALQMAGKPYQAPATQQQTANPKTVRLVAAQRDDEAANHANDPGNNSPHWYAALKRPEWWLVIAAVLTFGAIAYQAREMRFATQEMRNSLGEMKKQIALIEQQTIDITRQAVSARRQTTILRKSVAVAEDTAQRQLRAYVCLSSAAVKFYGAMFEAHVHLKNCGQTPAYNVRQWIHIWIEGYPLNIVLPEPPDNFEMSTAIIPPNGVHIMVGKRDSSVIVPQGLTLGSPQATVYVYGEVRYADAFNVERYTRYRLIWGGSEGGRKTFSDSEHVYIGVCQPDKQGNEAN